MRLNGIDAKNAAERASIALELAARSRTGLLWRNHDNCFEMGDGDEVIRIGLTKLRTSSRFRDGVRRCHGSPKAWRDYVAGYDSVSVESPIDPGVNWREMFRGVSAE